MSELISGKTAEFLNTKANYMLQVLPEHAGDDPESGLLRVPKGAEYLVKHRDCGELNFFNANFGMIITAGLSDVRWMSSGFDDHIVDRMQYMSDNYYSVILWQRNTLQQKVDEVRQHLGITNNNTLSVMIGREKSYLRKLLKRKASSATVEKVIAELDALIDSQSDGKIDADNYKTVGDASSNDVGLNLVKESLITANLKLKNGLLQNEIRELNRKLDLSNDVAEMWEENHKKSSRLNAWLFFIIILFIGLFIAWWAL